MLGVVLLVGAPVLAQQPVCPAAGPGTPETKLDCPWAGIVRLMETAVSLEQPVLPLLEKHAPGLLAQMRRDARSNEIQLLWGRSLNFDEGAKKTILNRSIYDTLAALIGVARQEGDAVHAGAEHTYGYLLSNLDTPFGYKRARWVEPDINAGFGFAEREISPAPDAGTLLSNLTVFAGRIAFRGDSSCLRMLDAIPAAATVRDFNFASLSVIRLVETVVVAERTVELRTDLAMFPNPQTKTQALLIYSVKDSAEPGARLISAFPVAGDFVARIGKPGNAGSGKKIKTRYNAFVKGITGADFTGEVKLLVFGGPVPPR